MFIGEGIYELEKKKEIQIKEGNPLIDSVHIIKVIVSSLSILSILLFIILFYFTNLKIYRHPHLLNDVYNISSKKLSLDYEMKK